MDDAAREHFAGRRRPRARLDRAVDRQERQKRPDANPDEAEEPEKGDDHGVAQPKFRRPVAFLEIDLTMAQMSDRRGERRKVTIGVSFLPGAPDDSSDCLRGRTRPDARRRPAWRNRSASVTTADYDRAVRMLAPALNGLVVGDTVNATWLPDGRFWYVRTTLTGTENVVIDPVKKTREVVATPPAGGQAAPARAAGAAGAAVAAAARRRRRRRHHQDVRPQRHRDDRPAAAVDVAGRHARRIFICDWNLWVRDVATGQERQLTTDGVKDFGYATSNAGWTTSAGAGAVVVARRQEDRDAAAGRAQGRRHVPRRDAGQRRPPGAPRVEVSAPRRSGRRDDHAASSSTSTPAR